MIKKTGKILSLLTVLVLSLLLVHTVLFAFENKSDSIDPQPPGSHPLLAKPAPFFKLELLDGGEFDLSQQKDKNIVILDFWATWCGPCIRVMPIMEEVANEYKDKGVILIAVNLREGLQKIRSFLQEQGLHPVVALDKDGAVGNVYKAQYIPQTVIIDKDGIVQAVHVGALPNLKETLKKELNDLLAGKKLTSLLSSLDYLRAEITAAARPQPIKL